MGKSLRILRRGSHCPLGLLKRAGKVLIGAGLPHIHTFRVFSVARNCASAQQQKDASQMFHVPNKIDEIRR